MPKYDIMSFKKIVEDIKLNYKPEKSRQICLLCNKPMSECKNCPIIFESASEYEIPKIVQKTDQPSGNQIKSDIFVHQPLAKSNNPPKYPEKRQYYNQTNYQQNRQYGNQINYEKNKPNENQTKFLQNIPLSQILEPKETILLENKNPDLKPQSIEKFDEHQNVSFIPNPSDKIIEPDKVSKLNPLSNVFVPKQKCQLEVCTPPTVLQNKTNRKRPSSIMQSTPPQFKRRKKAEQVVITFSKILTDLNLAIDSKKDVERSIHTAIDSIEENMADYAKTLSRSRSNMALTFDSGESIRSIVYKTLSQDVQTLHELSSVLQGKWRKKMIEFGADNIWLMFQEKRKEYPRDFLTIMDDDIEESLLALKVSDGKPHDIVPILNKINDAEYSIEFLSFVEGIKVQGTLSLKRERIQDVIKEYIVEDLNERSQKEIRKLTLLSQLISKTAVDDAITTIDLALNLSLAKLSQMGKRAKKYFTEITAILQIPESFDIPLDFSPRQSIIQYIKEESPEAAWNRAFLKNSPVKSVTLSPIAQGRCSDSTSSKDDPILEDIAWVLGMSEQFFFDNTLILMNQHKQDSNSMVKILKVNFKDFDESSVKDELTNIVILGSGPYGDVYRATKKGTNENYTIKYMKKFPPGLFSDNFKSIVSSFRDKNYAMTAKNSPFIIKFLQSFTIPNINGLFFIFEWCLCDLRKFVNLLDIEDHTSVSKSIWESEENGISKIFEKAMVKHALDFIPTVIVYVFELFCILDFLPKSNIIHQNLKPENIMISSHLHLKLGDFGLVFNTKFITKPYQNNLINVTDLNYFVDEPFHQGFSGTELYTDMELSFKHLKRSFPNEAKELMFHADALSYDISLAHSDPNILSDLWAGGVIATELLLGGTLFLHRPFIDSSVLEDMETTGGKKMVMLEITYIKRNYKRYIVDGLAAFGGPRFRQLTALLASIFRPRDQRASDFVQDKEIYFNQNRIVIKFIDISKIEKVDLFAKLELNSNNAFLYDIPQRVGDLVGKRTKEQYETLGELLKSTFDYSNSDSAKTDDLKPDTDIQII